MTKDLDRKERRRRSLERKRQDKRRNPIPRELGSKKYRQRIRQIKEQEFDLSTVVDETVAESD